MDKPATLTRVVYCVLQLHRPPVGVEAIARPNDSYDERGWMVDANA